MFEVGKLPRLALGYTGEAGARQIRIDMTAWLDMWPGAMIVVFALRPDKYPYFPATEMQDGVLTWTIEAEELTVAGKGTVQIAAIDKGTGREYHSRVVQTEVYASIEEFQTATAGDPAQKWVHQVLTARDEATAAAAEAKAWAEQAADAAAGAAVPTYWQNHLAARAEAVREAMAAAGWNRSAFLWYHDAHWSYNYQKSPALLKYLHQHTPINKTIFGGDIVDAEGDTPADMSYLWDWRSAVRDLPNHHSVPGNHDDGNSTDNRWDDAYIYNFLLAAEETPDIVRSDEGLYYYIDDKVEKTRYLYLDTATYDGNLRYNTHQQTWLKQALLSVPDDWHIVAVAHIWQDVDYSVWPPAAKGWNEAGKYALDMFDAYNARTGDYASCAGKVEFAIGGHWHVDGDFVSDGGIPVILTECDSRHIRSELDCTQGTTTEQSVNAVIADYGNGIVTVIRVGRGNSRIVHLDGSGSEEIPDDGTGDAGDSGEEEPEAPTGDFTNQLPLATDADGNIYNGIGYKTDTRISVSSGTDEDRDEEGSCTTGYIPVKTGDIVRFLNCTFNDYEVAEGVLRQGIYLFNSGMDYVTMSSTAVVGGILENENSNWHPVADENNNISQVTIPSNTASQDIAYMRIVMHVITKQSVITVNEEIIIDE